MPSTSLPPTPVALRSSSGIAAGWLALLLLVGGCCSTNPADLDSPDADERRETLACLAKDALDEAALRPDVARYALRRLDPAAESSAAVRATALRVLCALYDAGHALPDLTETAGRRLDLVEHERVRTEAIACLGDRRQDDAAAELLQRALREDPSGEVRLAAARELARRPAPPAATTRALIDTLADPHPSARLVAHRTLQLLHHVDFGLSRERWRGWFQGQVDRLPDEEGPAYPELPPPYPVDEEAPPPLPEPTLEPSDEPPPLPDRSAFPEETFPEEEYEPAAPDDEPESEE